MRAKDLEVGMKVSIISKHCVEHDVAYVIAIGKCLEWRGVWGVDDTKQSVVVAIPDWGNKVDSPSCEWRATTALLREIFPCEAADKFRAKQRKEREIAHAEFEAREQQREMKKTAIAAAGFPVDRFTLDYKSGAMVWNLDVVYDFLKQKGMIP